MMLRSRAPAAGGHGRPAAITPRAHVAAQRCVVVPPHGLQQAAPACATKSRTVVTASSNSGEAQTAVQAPLLELTKDNFWGFLEASADKLTVVDFYTDWCGPCKLISPELVKMNEELGPRKGQIVKFNCNKDNKELGKTLGIKVAPTFHLYRGRDKLAEMTGAKVDKLRELIESHL